MSNDPKAIGSTEVHLPRMALIASLLAFLVIGALGSALGSLLPLLQVRFGVSLITASTAVSAFYVGAACGGFGSLLGLEILDGGRLMAFALAALGIGALGVAASHQWSLLLVSMVCLGLGFGALDCGLNLLMTRTESRHRAARVNLLNSAFPIGAVLGPVLVTALGIGRLASGYLVIGLFSLTLAAAIRGMAAAPTRHPKLTDSRIVPSTTFLTQGRIFVGLLGIAYVLCSPSDIQLNSRPESMQVSGPRSQSVGSQSRR
jgi:fucose permease